MWKLILLVLGLLNCNATALYQVHQKAWLCVAGCRRSIDNIVFDVSEDLEGTCHQLYTASLFACTAVYCSRREIEIGYPSINQTFCIAQGTPLPPYNLTDASPPANISWVSYPDDADNRVYSETAVPDESFYWLGRNTENAANTAMTFNWALALSDIAFWALVLLFASTYHHANRLQPWMMLKCATSPGIRNPEPTTPSMQTSCRRLKRILAAVSAFLGCRFDAPSLSALLLILTYGLLNFVFCFLGYRYMPNSLLDWHTVQYERFIGNRCGYLVLGNLPVIWFFSFRTNPFLRLTNWSYETFNFFHKWVARLTVLLAIVHGICYTIGDSIQDIFVSDWKEFVWYRCGSFNILVVVSIILLSTRYFRRRAYDLFVVLHIGMAVAFLLLLKKHLTVWRYEIRKDVRAFIWACVAFWIFDRLLRLGSILYNALPTTAQKCRATATLDYSGEIIRIDVSARFRSKSLPRTGIHYYIYEPGQWRGYESHPFSLCSWSQTADVPASRKLSEFEASDGEKLTPRATVTDNTESAALGCTAVITAGFESPVDQRHTFLVRPQAGWTKRLREKLQAKASANPLHLTLLFEGPYGKRVPLHRHSDIVMILGGIGVTAAVSHIDRYLQSSLGKSSQPKPTLRIIWAASTWPFVQDILANELSNLSRHHANLPQLEIYLTAGTGFEIQGDRLDLAVNTTTSSTSYYRVHYGRPNLEPIITQAHQDCIRDLAVFCCAPLAFRNQCRRVVQKVQKASVIGNVTLYLESFSL